MPEVLFTNSGDTYMPTARSRGPWQPDSLHGGPVGALLFHGVESLKSDPQVTVARITVDLMRLVPIAGLSLETRVLRAGRRATFADIVLSTGGEIVARASAVLMRRNGDDGGAEVTFSHDPPPDWRDLALMPWMGIADQRPLFQTGLEIRKAAEPYTGGPMAVWVRVPYEFSPGRPLTPLERVGAIADLTSGMGIMSRRGSAKPFINGDISVHMFREPVGEWICLQSVGRGDCEGLATSSVNLHDETGLFGHSAVSAMARPLPGG